MHEINPRRFSFGNVNMSCFQTHTEVDTCSSHVPHMFLTRSSHVPHTFLTRSSHVPHTFLTRSSHVPHTFLTRSSHVPHMFLLVWTSQTWQPCCCCFTNTKSTTCLKCERVCLRSELTPRLWLVLSSGPSGRQQAVFDWQLPRSAVY